MADYLYSEEKALQFALQLASINGGTHTAKELIRDAKTLRKYLYAQTGSVASADAKTDKPVKGYVREELGRWETDRLEYSKGKRTPLVTLYTDYSRWYAVNKAGTERPLSSSVFLRYLSGEGHPIIPAEGRGLAMVEDLILRTTVTN